MSLSWPDFSPARIALRPGQAAVARAGQTRRCEAGEGWDGALAALDGLLEKGGRARASLSHHFVRLFLLPPPAVWLAPAEMAPWLQEQLAPALGGGETWRHVWEPAPPGHPILAAAMPEGRLEQLRDALGRHDVRLDAATPWLRAAWKRAAWKHAGVASGWLALLEPGQILLLGLRDGVPITLRQRQLAAQRPADQELADLLARESLLCGLAADAPLHRHQAGVGLEGADGSHDPLLGLL